MKRKPPWEDVLGIPVLRLYSSDDHGDWSKPANKSELHPDYPQIVLLDLTDVQFKQFKQDPVKYVNDHQVYPDPVKGVSPFPKVPRAKGKGGSVSYTVVVVRNHDSTISPAVGIHG